MMKIRHFILFLYIMGCCFFSQAQKYYIRGNLISQQAKPVTEANISLFNQDSVLVQGCSSDFEGKFSLNNIKSGDYLLNISRIGYKPLSVPLLAFSDNLKLTDLKLDSLTVLLDQVEVGALSKIRKFDRQLIFPTKQQMATSGNALSLLQGMMLPRILVDLQRNQVIGAGGGNVVLCINGREVSKEEIIALRAKDIIRVEYHDFPGLRYSGAEAVIDFIVKKYYSGGYISADLTNALTDMYGHDIFTFKLNHKKSDFTVIYNVFFRDYNKYRKEYDQTFYFHYDTLFRRERGIPSEIEFYNHLVVFNYGYQDSLNLLNAQLQNSYQHQPHLDIKNKVFLWGKENEENQVADFITSYFNNPSFSLYYQRILPNDQLFSFNTFFNNYKRNYKRNYIQENSADITEIYTHVHEEQNSVNVNMQYEKKIKNARLSAGVEYSHLSSKSKYKGDQQSDHNLLKDDLYFYTEFRYQLPKQIYLIGVGGNFLRLGESGINNYQAFSFTPKIQWRYSISESLYVYYRGMIYNNIPSLAGRSSVSQQVDMYQIRRGNPNLKRGLDYSNSFYFGADKKNWSITCWIDYLYRDCPVTDITFLENENVILSYDNQKSYHKFSMELWLTLKPIENHLTFNINLGRVLYRLVGDDLHSHLVDWHCNLDLLAMYRNWRFYARYTSPTRSLSGDRVFHGDMQHFLSLSYNKRNFSCALTAKNLFGALPHNYLIGGGKVAPYKSWEYMNDFNGMIALKLTYNFGFGKKIKNKQLNFNSNTRSTILESSK